MKKLVFSASLMMALSGATFASNNPGTDSKVYTPASYHFDRQFQGAENIHWDVSSGFFQKVTFTQNGVQKIAFYDKTNHYLATTHNVDFLELPALAVKNLIKNYPNYEVGSVIKYDDGHTVYFINLKNEHENFLVNIEPDGQVKYFKKLL